MNSYTGGVGEIRAASVGSGWTFTDNIIDASQGGIYFNTNDVATPSATTISDTRSPRPPRTLRAAAGTTDRRFCCGARREQRLDLG